MKEYFYHKECCVLTSPDFIDVVKYCISENYFILIKNYLNLNVHHNNKNTKLQEKSGIKFFS